ncbi:MAG TPA: heme exporter protein CcmD [Gammaproteobacteria bacterium]|nr:heme exporter protein CcmD [Gammaproteobacteria bacterium]
MLSEFLNMGGYAAYVWPVYGVAAVILIANLVTPWREEKQIIRDLKRRQRRESRGIQ